ncbi:unnamed protein product [Closterium sp. Naga37s-1]|nr:unnamed protein product [Closterium sp. Naga37s-1]
MVEAGLKRIAVEKRSPLFLTLSPPLTLHSPTDDQRGARHDGGGRAEAHCRGEAHTRADGRHVLGGAGEAYRGVATADQTGGRVAVLAGLEPHTGKAFVDLAGLTWHDVWLRGGGGTFKTILTPLLLCLPVTHPPIPRPSPVYPPSVSQVHVVVMAERELCETVLAGLEPHTSSLSTLYTLDTPLPPTHLHRFPPPPFPFPPVHVVFMAERELCETVLAGLGVCGSGGAHAGHAVWVPGGGGTGYRHRHRCPITTAPLSVHVVFMAERELCETVLAGLEPHTGKAFADLAGLTLGMLFGFGEAVARSKKSPEKVSVLMDMYETMRDLMPQVEVVFAGSACDAIRGSAQQLLQHLAAAAKEAFNNFELAVESEDSDKVLPDGATHGLTSYVLSGDHAAIRIFSPLLPPLPLSFPPTHSPPFSYQAIMQELSGQENLYQVTMQELFGRENLFGEATIRIFAALHANLERKSKLYRDPALTQLFLMNNVHYIVHAVRKGELKEVVGKDWIDRQRRIVQQHAAAYQRTSWNKSAVASIPVTPPLLLHSSHYTVLPFSLPCPTPSLSCPTPSLHFLPPSTLPTPTPSFPCPAHSIPCPAHSIPCPAHSIPCPAHSIPCPAHSIPCPAHSIPCPAHSIPCPAHSIPCPAHSIPCPAHSIPCPTPLPSPSFPSLSLFAARQIFGLLTSAGLNADGKEGSVSRSALKERCEGEGRGRRWGGGGGFGAEFFLGRGRGEIDVRGVVGLSADGKEGSVSRSALKETLRGGVGGGGGDGTRRGRGGGGSGGEMWGMVQRGQCNPQRSQKRFEEGEQRCKEARFRVFNATFEELHRSQCMWKIPDPELRSAVQLQIAEVLLPAYRAFVQRYT